MTNGRVKRRSTMIRCIAFALFVVLLGVCAAEVLMPQAGKKTKKDGGLTIDFSNQSEGYVLVKGAKGKKKLKVRVKMGDNTLNYDLNNSGEYEVFPLQFGNGKYTFTLYKNVSGKKYSEEGKITITAKMEDESRAFLYPNQYINYTPETPAVVEAGKICEGKTDPKEIFDTVCKYMVGHFAYDFIKSVSVKSGQLPEIDAAWEKHMGICQDLSAIMVAMLRSQGVPARMMIGTLGSGIYHAWVTAIINGEDVFYDPTAELNGVSKNETYTVERYY